MRREHDASRARAEHDSHGLSTGAGSVPLGGRPRAAYAYASKKSSCAMPHVRGIVLARGPWHLADVSKAK